mmetsp:Transcript_29277/g.67416  ORF Transcript_29277/g.67416 Transcript_29277/m.67416 type:complete len:222 (+) Transcript_29277:243-908(+)
MTAWTCLTLPLRWLRWTWARVANWAWWQRRASCQGTFWPGHPSHCSSTRRRPSLSGEMPSRSCRIERPLFCSCCTSASSRARRPSGSLIGQLAPTLRLIAAVRAFYGMRRNKAGLLGAMHAKHQSRCETFSRRSSRSCKKSSSQSGRRSSQPAHSLWETTSGPVPWWPPVPMAMMPRAIISPLRPLLISSTINRARCSSPVLATALSPMRTGATIPASRSG